MKSFYNIIYTNKMIVYIILFYRLLLDIVFKLYISPLWVNVEYGTFTNKSIEYGIYIFSWIVIIFTSYWITELYKVNKSSSIVLILLYFISFVPFTSMMAFSTFSMDFNLMTIIYWLVLIYVHKFFIKFSDKKIIINNNGSNKIFIIIILVISIVTTYYLGKYSEFRIDLNIENAYQYRMEVRQFTLPIFLQYFIGISRFLIPIGIMYSIKNKKLIIGIVLIICTFINYSYDGGKALLFLSIIALILGIIIKNYNKNLFIISFPIIMILGIVEKILHKGYFMIIVLRRLLFVPNLINSYVYNRISNIGPNYFSHLLRFFGRSINNIDINYDIGWVYFNDPNMSANSGLVGDAIWQLGYSGIIILPIIINIFLLWYDITTNKVSKIILIIPHIIIAYYLNNSSITAALFSHGIIFFTLLLLIYNEN